LAIVYGLLETFAGVFKIVDVTQDLVRFKRPLLAFANEES